MWTRQQRSVSHEKCMICRIWKIATQRIGEKFRLGVKDLAVALAQESDSRQLTSLFLVCEYFCHRLKGLASWVLVIPASQYQEDGSVRFTTVTLQSSWRTATFMPPLVQTLVATYSTWEGCHLFLCLAIELLRLGMLPLQLAPLLRRVQFSVLASPLFSSIIDFYLR